MNNTTFQGNGKITYVPVVVDAKPKPITNADRIRAMSDEELAEVMWAGCDNITPAACMRHPGCVNCWLDWLQQEVNDGKEEKEENKPAK